MREDAGEAIMLLKSFSKFQPQPSSMIPPLFSAIAGLRQAQVQLSDGGCPRLEGYRSKERRLRSRRQPFRRSYRAYQPSGVTDLTCQRSPDNLQLATEFQHGGRCCPSAHTGDASGAGVDHDRWEGGGDVLSSRRA
eukprot:749626-Hanusia_phi.AAC.2